jgi:CDP-glucose 4,6-dehydratase
VPDCVRAWSVGSPVSVRSPRATRPWQHVLEPLSGYLWLGARLLARQAELNGEAFNFGPDGSVNHTVAQLLEAMQDSWPGVTWQVPDGAERGGHEATLLKLSCDKALFHLGWRAVLQFPETVAFTVEWYRNWLEKKVPVDSFTRGQIARYGQLARERGLAWTSS